MSSPPEAWSSSREAFLFPEALSDAGAPGCGAGGSDIGPAEEALIQAGFLEMDEDLYTNAVLSILSPLDSCVTRCFSLGIILFVAVLQFILAYAIQSHVSIAMSWTSDQSVKRTEMHTLYEDLRHDGRLEYLRLEQKDVITICGDFEYDLEETNLPGTNWTAFYDYKKDPVDNWDPDQIPPTDRSELDSARFVLANRWYQQVYIIVTFVWILTIVNEFRLIGLYLVCCSQMPLVQSPNEPIMQMEGDDYRIVAFTPAAKLVAIASGLYRGMLTGYLCAVGIGFLIWTPTHIDLILNALALTFVLELDHITYKAAISRSRQNMISKLHSKSLVWHDRFWECTRRHINSLKAGMMALTVFGSLGITMHFRWNVQYRAYMNKFALAASICLFQGPTPGYWAEYLTTFPVPGLCETILKLKCEAPLVGENGLPCYQDWTQMLCKFYVETDSYFSTWSSIDWKSQGPCVSALDPNRLRLVHSLILRKKDITWNILANTCKEMFQQRPMVRFRGKEHLDTGPRTRVYPYRTYRPSAPLWCPFRNGTDAVLTPNQPAHFQTWKKSLMQCRKSLLVYTNNHTNKVMEHQAWKQSEDARAVEQMASSHGAFSGIWAGTRVGILIISQQRNDSAEITKPGETWSPATAFVHGNRISMLSGPRYTGTLDAEGSKIVLSTGEELVNQKAQNEKERPPKAKTRKGPGFPFFWR